MALTRTEILNST